MDSAEFRDLHSDTIGKEPAYTATSVERESTINYFSLQIQCTFTCNTHILIGTAPQTDV